MLADVGLNTFDLKFLAWHNQVLWHFSTSHNQVQCFFSSYVQKICNSCGSIYVWAELEWGREVCCVGERRWAWVVSGPFNSSDLSNWKQGFWTFTPREKLIKSQRDRRLRTLCSSPFVRDSICTLTFHQTSFLTIPWVRCRVKGACRERHDRQLPAEPTAKDTTKGEGIIGQQ